MATDPEPSRRFFTPAEANALLPEMIARTEQIADRVRRARGLTEGLREPDDRELGTGALEELDILRVEIEAIVDEILGAGVEVKGLLPALLDFPAIMNGQEVVLCWREGEDRVAFWHPTSTGYAGRQPVDFARLGAWEWCN